MTTRRVMRNYRIADLVLRVDLTEPLSVAQAEPYRVDDELEPDLVVNLGEGMYDNYFKLNVEDPNFREYALMRFVFQTELLKFGGLELHSSAVAYNGRAFLFSADSGVGKSTHANYWLQLLGTRDAYILNDDAPALRKIDGVWYAYGTPWAGESLINVNAKVALQSICFIERSETNWARRVEPDEAFPLFMAQTCSPLGKRDANVALDKILELLSDAPIFRLGCALNVEAARVAFEATSNA